MIIYDGSNDIEQYKNVFGEEMAKVCAEDDRVVYLDCDLMNSVGTYKLWKENRRQAINVGISEANAAGIAAGLSAGGLRPYLHTFGPFASRRCYDQVFVSVAYAGNSVRIFGSDAGVTAAFNGGTHMPFEDIALYRAIPNSTVIDISDAALLRSVIHQIKSREGVTYVRTTRKAYPTLYSADHPFRIGKGEILRDGDDITIIAAGLLVSEALKAATILAAEGIGARVIDMFTIKPIDAALISESAKKTKAFVTAENHNATGGLGDAVLSALSELGILKPLTKVAVKEEFGSVGPQDYLQEFYGLTAKGIVDAAKNTVGESR
jgi:transketolase